LVERTGPVCKQLIPNGLSLVAGEPTSPIKLIHRASLPSHRECIAHFSHTRCSHLNTCTDRLLTLFGSRTVPTEDEILVPETLLKKRKSQEKQREERSAELEKKKKVSLTPPCLFFSPPVVRRAWTMVMTTTILQTRPLRRCCFLTIFRV